MTEEQTKTTDWLTEEQEELNQQKTFDGEKLPSLQFEENKIVEFTVDFSNKFDKWEDTVNKSTKAIIPVTEKGEKKILWLNIKNPLYRDLIHSGVEGKNNFKVMQIGSKRDTKYNLVKE